MTDSYVWHDTFICVPWAQSYVWRDAFICVTWRIHTWDMTHSYVWHDSFMCVTWLIHVCDMTQSHVWHDSIICVTWSFIGVTWLIYMCDMMHSYVWHDSFRRGGGAPKKRVIRMATLGCHRRLSPPISLWSKSCHTCEWVMSHMWMSHATHVK